MAVDPLAPCVGTPPRIVYEWTSVVGHIVRTGGTLAQCSCGERQPVPDVLIRTGRGATLGRRLLTGRERAEVRRASRAWEAEHLRQAWPLLVEQADGEAIEEFADRVGVALEQARSFRDQLDREADMADGAITVISDAQTDAGVRAAVLKHQYNALCQRLGQEHEIAGESDAMMWLARGAGDPLHEI